MSDILTWLCAPDSSPKFNNAYEAQQECPETGEWLLRNERYTRWKSDRRSSLWIHGKGNGPFNQWEHFPPLLMGSLAGSGKTVLS
jgi:hypothetical protein